jgi:hypothetical protein
MGDFDKLNWECFLSTGFTHHYEILVKTKSLEEVFATIDALTSTQVQEMAEELFATSPFILTYI